jgi:hypothetical protein
LYQNKLNNILKISKRKYYNNYFIHSINDTKRVWKGIKQIIHSKTKVNKKIMKIVDGENEITDPIAIANAFNDYFSNVGNILAAKIPTVQTPSLQYLTDCPSSSFFLSPVTYVEIEDEISKLRIEKATGPFSIPVTALKILKTFISKPLEIIFNIYFITGTVPSYFKLANVIPIYKSGTLISICNYRPISLLSVFN